jgi:transcriptional regulator with XRE-family HTH domain
MGSQHANRIQFKKNYQKRFFATLINRLKVSQRKLAEKLNVSRRTLRNWMNEKRLIPENILFKCLKLLPELSSYKKFVINTYPENWGQIKGGKIRGKMKSNLTRRIRIRGFRNANLKTVKRRILGPLGEKMYNIGERKLAEFLLNHGLKYKYEPVINLGRKYAFPDFLVKNTIIERCGYSDWPGYWNRLTEKTKLYEKFFKGKLVIVVPENRFKIAIRRVSPYVKNVIILKENEIDILPNFIM